MASGSKVKKGKKAGTGKKSAAKARRVTETTKDWTNGAYAAPF